MSNQEKSSNGIGLAGFIVSLVGLFTAWVPIVGWIIVIVGAILSAVGLTKEPKTFAIVGIILSGLSVLWILAVLLIFADAASSLPAY
ncbi:MAG: hypothetical protein P8H43_09985 [Crocinitomicaceae bacterium]|jgi:hypothetical protein|nr:hypothetical protein [Crocinitomicaceae bacterium]